MDNRPLTSTWWTLKLALGVVPLLAGFDKFVNVGAPWAERFNPAVSASVPIAPELFLQCLGVVEILVGLAILTRWTKLGAYLAALWFAAMAVNFITMATFDVAVRDLVLSVLSFTLARLTEARRRETATTVAYRPVTSDGLLRLNL